jgi:hypothetical protein
MWTIVISVVIKILEMWIDRNRTDKELNEAFLQFQKAYDAHRSLKVHESAQGQRERLGK